MKMSQAFRITTAAIVLFAGAALSRAQGTGRADAGAGTVSELPVSLTSTDAPLPVAADTSVTHVGNPDSMKFNAQPMPARSWVLVPLEFYVLPVFIIAVVLTFRHLRIRTLHKTLRAMIEKGIPVTPELVAALKPSGDPRGQRMCYLLPGLICSAVGIGLLINAGKSGLIPLLIGVAFLICWQVDKRSTKANQPPGQ